MILPGDEPSDLGRCNYDTLSPKLASNGQVMSRGFSDEAIVVIKRSAEDDAVTYLRVKLMVRNRTLKAKGGTCKIIYATD